MKSLALVVDERGAALELNSNRSAVVLRHRDGRCERVGLRALASVVLNGDVAISTAVLRALAAENVALVCSPIRGRTPAIGFTRLPEHMTSLRHQQHLIYAHDTKRLHFARLTVAAKLEGMAAASPSRAAVYETCRTQLMQCRQISAVMGVEGAATRRHYEGLSDQMRGGYEFTGRNRRPPRDPVNALMSYAYTLAEAPIAQLVARFGLDVQVGFLHGIHRNRNSLALDLLEPARPALDSWLVDLLCERHVLSPDRFNCSEADGCRLDKDARREFLRLWFAEGQLIALRSARPLLAAMLRGLRSDTATLKRRSRS